MTDAVPEQFLRILPRGVPLRAEPPHHRDVGLAAGIGGRRILSPQYAYRNHRSQVIETL